MFFKKHDDTELINTRRELKDALSYLESIKTVISVPVDYKNLPVEVMHLKERLQETREVCLEQSKRLVSIGALVNEKYARGVQEAERPVQANDSGHERFPYVRCGQVEATT